MKITRNLLLTSTTAIVIATIFLPTNTAANEENPEQLNIYNNIPDLQSGITKIIGGSPANITDYPWYVLVASYSGHFCGGSLIAPDVVLSAAHCASLDVALIGNETIEIESELLHPNYNDNTLSHDFMLLKLKTPSQAPLVRMDDGLLSDKYDETKSIWVVGHGDTDPDPDIVNVSDMLLEAELKYVAQERCASAYSQVDYYGYGINIDDSMMCAASPGKDSCQGDSGGPLYDKQNGVLTGVVSFGVGCAHPEFPGVYGRIAYVLPWIQKFICEHSNSDASKFDFCKCNDVSAWSFSEDQGCVFFSNNPFNCYLHGDEVGTFRGLTANEACCACGGGITTRVGGPPKSSGSKVGGKNSRAVATIGGMIVVISALLL